MFVLASLASEELCFLMLLVITANVINYFLYFVVEYYKGNCSIILLGDDFIPNMRCWTNGYRSGK